MAILTVVMSDRCLAAVLLFYSYVIAYVDVFFVRQVIASNIVFLGNCSI